MSRRKRLFHSPMVSALILIVGALTVGPVVMLIIGSFSEGIGALGKFTTEKYITAYSDPMLPQVLLNTVIFTLGCASFSTVLGGLIAYLSVRTDIPLRACSVLPVVPMMIPRSVRSCLIVLLNPTNGMLNLFLRNLFGFLSGPFNIYSLAGMIFLEGMLDLPVTYLVISPAMYSFDTTLEEASRVCGASNLLTLRRITLPILKPAFLATFTLAIIRSLAAFAVPSMVGMPGRIHVLTTYVYRIISIGWAPDYGKAAAIGLIVLGVSIALIYVYRRLVSESSQYVTVTGKGYRPTVVELGRARYPLFALCSLLFCFLVAIPLVTLIYMSFLPYSMIPSARAVSMMNLKNWRIVLETPVVLRALKNSVFLALVGATLGILLSVFVAYVIVKVKSKGSAILEALTFLSFSFPGMIIGVGLCGSLFRLLFTPLFGVCSLRISTYIPYGVRPLRSAFMQIDYELEESRSIQRQLPASSERYRSASDCSGCGLCVDSYGLYVHPRTQRFSGSVASRTEVLTVRYEACQRRPLGPGGRLGHHHDRRFLCTCACCNIAAYSCGSRGLIAKQAGGTKGRPGGS